MASIQDSVRDHCLQIPGHGLKSLTTEALAAGFQASESNPIVGIAPRAELLRTLGESLLENADVFGTEGRPGNIVGENTFS